MGNYALQNKKFILDLFPIYSQFILELFFIYYYFLLLARLAAPGFMSWLSSLLFFASGVSATMLFANEQDYLTRPEDFPPLSSSGFSPRRCRPL
mmetsp:Transcript_10683/g.25711  ORF Transcript_10683/g.25711 Transcript_10683/m.25711 type:complete len:94 (+) Transcript_10683:26-307(+)